ncbi:MAG: TlpA family protein disulfide reductase [Polyangiaceae bacterium]|nr:TlpA family protein disulfide reductase [Polyangiaceae bacterium]
MNTMRQDLKRIVPLLVGLLLFSLIFAVGGGRLGCGSSIEGEPAPDFTAIIRSGEGRGDRVELAALRGRVVVLDFWAHWCEPCRVSTPELNAVRESLGDSPVSFYGVNVEANLAPRRVIEEHVRFGATFPTFHDEDRSMTTAYRADRLPTIVVIDREGIVRFRGSGVPDRRRFERLIRELL